MTDQATERLRIDAPPARCFAVAADFEAYPEWARDVREVTVVERDDEGRGAVVQFKVAAMGKTIRYVLRYDYVDAPNGFSWQLVEGESLRRLDGTYRFEPVDEEATQVTYDLVVDLTLPLPGLLRRKAAGMVTGAALSGLKQRVERDAGG